MRVKSSSPEGLLELVGLDEIRHPLVLIQVDHSFLQVKIHQLGLVGQHLC